MFANVQIPLRPVKIHQLPSNTYPSQKTSEHQTTASIAGLRNASCDSCGFAVESERICRGRELLSDVSPVRAFGGGALLDGNLGPGTDFEQFFDILHGDANRNSSTSVTDILFVASTIPSFFPAAPYDQFADINGNHSISVTDLVAAAAFAVGTALSGRPPHRSVREELPHTAPPLGMTVEVHLPTCRSRLSRCFAWPGTVSGASRRRAAFPLGGPLSSTDSAAGVPVLFVRFAGTIGPSDFLLVFMSAVPSETFSDRSTVR